VKTRRAWHPAGGPGRAGGAEAEREAGLIEEIAAEFSTEELLEFLEADQLPAEADPEFRERLRSELWNLVQSLAGKR
jgi:hypothetical protein